MNAKTLLNKIRQLKQAHEKYTALEDELTTVIDSLCDFDAVVTYIPGDGFMVLNLANDETMQIHNICGYTERQKLSALKHQGLSY